MAHRPLPLALVSLALVVACETHPDIQPLPPGDPPSPEVRAGLPEVAGRWAFSGLRLPVEERPETTLAEIIALQGIVVDTQRLDSIAGAVHLEGETPRFYGEVRRDGVVSLVAAGEDAARYVAGRVNGDTLWISLTNMEFAAELPRGSALALMRDPPEVRFLQLRGGRIERLDPPEEPDEPDEPDEGAGEDRRPDAPAADTPSASTPEG